MGFLRHSLFRAIAIAAGLGAFGMTSAWSKELLPVSVGPVEIPNCTPEKAATLGLHLSYSGGKPKALTADSFEIRHKVTVRPKRGAYPRWLGRVVYSPSPSGTGTVATAHLGNFEGPQKKPKSEHQQSALDDLDSFLARQATACGVPVDSHQAGLREEFDAVSPDLRIQYWADAGSGKLEVKLSDKRKCSAEKISNACRLSDNPNERRVFGGTYRLEPLEKGRVVLWVKSSSTDPDYVKKECNLACKGSSPRASAASNTEWKDTAQCQALLRVRDSITATCDQAVEQGKFPNRATCLQMTGPAKLTGVIMDLNRYCRVN